MTIPISQPSPADAAERAGFAAERLLRLTHALVTDIESAAIPGAVVLVLRDGAVAYRMAYGYADRRTLRPMNTTSIFRIASMTKPITAVAALMLMEQGKLLLTDPVHRYIPQFKSLEVHVESGDAPGAERRTTREPCRRPMTIHDLMRHTAGFTYGQFGDSPVQRAYRAAQLIDTRQSNAQMVEKLASLPLQHQPGTTFEYGMSTDVLGHVVELVSGMPLDRFFENHITGPLGMADTAFGVAENDVDRLAEPARSAAPGNPPAVMPYDPARPAAWLSGGGGLLSTADDYGRFAQMLVNAGELDGVRLLGRKTVELMTRNHLPATLGYGARTADLGIAAPLPAGGYGYGLGIGVRISDGLSPVPGNVGDIHWGGALGPYFWADPREKLVVVFMLQELNVQVRTRYRALLRGLIYQALR